MNPVKIVGPMAKGIGHDFVGFRKPGEVSPESRMRGQLKRGITPKQGADYENEGEGVEQDEKGNFIHSTSAVVPHHSWLKTHEELVRDAIDRGDHVPEHVMKDYPHLKQSVRKSLLLHVVKAIDKRTSGITSMFDDEASAPAVVPDADPYFVFKAIDRRGGKLNNALEFPDSTPGDLDAAQENAVRHLEAQHRAGVIHLKRLSHHAEGDLHAHYFEGDGTLHALKIAPHTGLSYPSLPYKRHKGDKVFRRYTDHSFAVKPPKTPHVKRLVLHLVHREDPSFDFNEEEHPRASAGSGHGGQFVEKPHPELDFNAPEFAPAPIPEPEAPKEPVAPTVQGMRLSELARWSEPRRINTKNGERNLRTASPTEAFWNCWRANKEKLKEHGISVSKDPRSGAWEVQWWQPLTTVQVAKKVEAIENSRATNSDRELAAPAGLNYLPYQKAGIAFGLDRNNVLIADDMGLGKTVEAIGIVNNDPTINSVLVICPASLKINWKREFDKWKTRGLSVGIADGKTMPDTDVVIVNYDILKKHHDALRTRKWDCLISDESHYLKNSKTIRATEVLGGKESTPIAARKRIFMTGTPIVNRPEELWTLVHSLDPDGLGKSWQGFMTRYAAAKQTRYGWDTSGASNLDELQQRLRSSFMIRRLKGDVLKDLPPKTRQIIELPADTPELRKALEAENAAYEQRAQVLERLAAVRDLAEASGNTAAYEDAVSHLKAAADIAFDEISKERHRLAVAKVPAVIDHIKEQLENVSKIVVFAHHYDVVDAIKAAFPAGECVEVTGRCSAEQRDRAVTDFQTKPGVKLFVGNIRAAGVGLTLTAAQTVDFAELDWTPGNVTQAEDRLHRIGQVGNVLVQHLVVDGSLDSKMAKTLVEKQANIDKALDKDGKPVDAASASALEDPVIPLSTEADRAADKAAMPGASAAKPLSERQVAAVHSGLKISARLDPDRAGMLNDQGFNAYDGTIGHSLAGSDNLSQKQAALGFKVLRKYRRQLGDIYDEIYGEEVKKGLRLRIGIRKALVRTGGKWSDSVNPGSPSRGTGIAAGPSLDRSMPILRVCGQGERYPPSEHAGKSSRRRRTGQRDP